MKQDRDPKEMTRAELEALIETLQEQRDRLEDEVPEDSESEAYLEWEEQCDLLEDQIDELWDLLDEM